jgi:sarcosine oxidase subunit beta
VTVRSAEVAVVGGGILGMACAYELAAAGAQVVLFERRALAGGTTGGSAGVVCLHDMGELYAVLSLVGYDRVRRLQRDHGYAFHQYGSMGYWRAGEPELDTEPSAFAAAYDTGPDSIYYRVRLTSQQMRSRFGWLPDDVAGGVLYPNQGFINPYELVDLYSRLGQATGRLTVLPGTPVLAIKHDGDRVTRLVTRRGAFDVGTVVNAAGPWGAKVAGLAGVGLDLIPQRIQVAVATGYEDGIERTPLVSWPGSVDGASGWCRGEEGDTLLFGEHHHVPDPRYTVDPDFADMANDVDFPAQVAEMVRRHWKLPTAEFLPGWNCIYGMTPDGYPLVGTAGGLSNLVHVLGCNGHGVTLHAGLAQAVTARVLHQTAVIDLGSVPGAPATLDTAWLSPERFAAGRELRLDFAGPTPSDRLVGSGIPLRPC